MYNYLSGEVVEISDEHMVLDVNGIGYNMLISNTSLSELTLGSFAKVYTRLIVKEDEFSLCGFSDERERRVFDYLITVSGVGKKLAMSMLSSLSYLQIVSYIVKGDVKSLTKLKGVGKKTAERMSVELTDKFKKQYGDMSDYGDGAEQVIAQDYSDEILLALSGLGFSGKEINTMLTGMPENYTVEEAIKYALKNKMK